MVRVRATSRYRASQEPNSGYLSMASAGLYRLKPSMTNAGRERASSSRFARVKSAATGADCVK